MATAAVGIAPVLTPHTLGVLADTFESVKLPEKALSLRRLQPFVETVVERHFVPLTARVTKGRFVNRFNKLSTDFEPFRLYLNSRLVGILDAQELLGFYEQIISEALGPLMKAAHEMDMGPELISAVVRDYFRIVQALAQLTQSTDVATTLESELTVEQFTKFIDWFHAATRFDYGLTAIFLVLEGRISKPFPTDKASLLSACKEGLLELGQATSKLFVHQDIHSALQSLETPHVEITSMWKGFRDASSSRLDEAQEKSTSRSSPRQTEIDWLTRNKNLSERYGGQWIVLEKDELVANDTDYQKARETAVQRGIKRPFIIFVPRKESGGFMGI